MARKASEKFEGPGDRTPEQALAEANTRTSNLPDPVATETVRVLAGRVVYHEGEAYVERQVFDVATADAEALADAGQVEIVSAPERRKH